MRQVLQWCDRRLIGVMSLVVALAFAYVLAWLRGGPVAWLSMLWTWGVLVIAVPMCVLQVLCFVLVPRDPKKGAGRDLVSVLMLYVISLLWFSALYYSMPRDFGLGSPSEIEMIRARLKEIHDTKKTDEFRRAEEEERRLAEVEKKIATEMSVTAMMKSPARTGRPWIDIPAERARKIRERRERLGVGGTPLTFAEQLFLEESVKKRYRAELDQLDTNLLRWRADLVAEESRLVEAIEQYSFLNALYFASAAGVEMTAATARGKMVVIGQRIWMFFLLVIYLTALQTRGGLPSAVR